MLLWSVAVLIGMEDTPKSAAGGAGGGDGEGAAAAVGAVDASKTASETAKANAVAAATGASYGSEMARAAANPLIWCAALGQMTATPIAEFQSQVCVLQSPPPPSVGFATNLTPSRTHYLERAFGIYNPPICLTVP